MSDLFQLLLDDFQSPISLSILGCHINFHFSNVVRPTILHQLIPLKTSAFRIVHPERSPTIVLSSTASFSEEETT